jgi:hypothetical protein
MKHFCLLIFLPSCRVWFLGERTNYDNKWSFPCTALLSLHSHIYF